MPSSLVILSAGARDSGRVKILRLPVILSEAKDLKLPVEGPAGTAEGRQRKRAVFAAVCRLTRPSTGMTAIPHLRLRGHPRR